MNGGSRLDPRTGVTLTLTPDGLTVYRADGRRGFIPAPHGYELSHFGEGLTVVARGDEPSDGWRDWHFEPDIEAGLLRRLGPAY